MATFDSTNIEFTFIDNPNSWAFSYSGMPLSSSFPEASQIQVRYEAVQVYSGGTAGGGGVLVSLSDLAPALQEQIRVLSTNLYVVDATAHNVTVQDLSNQQANVTGLVETYFYAPTAAPSSLTPLRIRRSTDITTAVITYQPGARLTSDVLNTTTAQLLNATQELTAFSQSSSTSGGGSSGTPDLSGNILDDIGDVDTPTGTGPLIWNDSQSLGRWSVGNSGNFVPAGGTLDVNHVLRKASTDSGAYEWWDILNGVGGLASRDASITANSNDIFSLQEKTQHQTATTSDTTFGLDVNIGGNLTANALTSTTSITTSGTLIGSALRADTVNGATGFTLANTGSGAGGTLTMDFAGSYFATRNQTANGMEWYSGGSNLMARLQTVGRLTVYDEADKSSYTAIAGPDATGDVAIQAVRNGVSQFYVYGDGAAYSRDNTAPTSDQLMNRTQGDARYAKLGSNSYSALRTLYSMNSGEFNLPFLIIDQKYMGEYAWTNVGSAYLDNGTRGASDFVNQNHATVDNGITSSYRYSFLYYVVRRVSNLATIHRRHGHCLGSTLISLMSSDSAGYGTAAVSPGSWVPNSNAVHYMSGWYHVEDR